MTRYHYYLGAAEGRCASNQDQLNMSASKAMDYSLPELPKKQSLTGTAPSVSGRYLCLDCSGQ
eukprot:624557-Pelagomonas_calceolata.AAC.2